MHETSFPRRLRVIAVAAALTAGVLAAVPAAPAARAQPPAQAQPSNQTRPSTQAQPRAIVQMPDPLPEGDYHRTAADQGKAITPTESFIRGEDWIRAGHAYNQKNTSITDRHGTAYRADCSGFVSMTWHAPRAFSTEDIESVAKPISWDELGPGDALNRKKAPARDGHIVLVVKRLPGGIIQIMHFGSTPPKYDIYLEGVARADGFYPIRYNKMQVVTDEMVRKELERRTPKPRPSIQPADGRTLVNFDSIFYVDGSPYHETVPMAGGSVNVELYAEQTKWLWKFGDNTEQPSTHPGKPYPGTPAITHQYTTTGTAQPSVDITWSNYRYRIVGENGGDWHDVDGSHTGTGPTTPLTVLELQSVLGTG